MKTFKQFQEDCWKGYTAIGVKKKGNRTVPNCVPVKEDGGAAGGVGGGAMSAGPTNVVGGGAIAGSGGKGGEPGVDLRKKKKVHNPVMMGMGSRKPPKI